MKMNCEKELLKKMGLDCEMPDTGCCGMAGSFGFEAEKYDVSKGAANACCCPRCAPRGRDTLMIADGFSCREQVRQTTDRVPLHLAEVIQMGMREGAAGTPGDYPERKYITPVPARPSFLASVAVLAGGLFLAGAIFGLSKGRD